MFGSVPPDVYTARDIAQAAGVSEPRVLQLDARGEIRSIAAQLPIASDPSLATFVNHHEAVRAVRALKQGSTVGVAGALGLGRELFAQDVRAGRSTTVPLIVSTSLHGIAIATILFVASHAFDCVGAKAYGMHTCFVNRRGVPFGDWPYQPDLVVPDFTELAKQLCGG